MSVDYIDYNCNDCINVEVSGSESWSISATLVITIKQVMIMIKLNSDKGRKIISDYISALNGDEEAINWAYDRRKAEYDTYDDELKDSVDKCFDCI